MDSKRPDALQAPGSRLVRLYQRWADGGADLLITGNVMIDRRALASPGSVVLDSARHLDALAAGPWWPLFAWRTGPAAAQSSGPADADRAGAARICPIRHQRGCTDTACSLSPAADDRSPDPR